MKPRATCAYLACIEVLWIWDAEKMPMMSAASSACHYRQFLTDLLLMASYNPRHLDNSTRMPRFLCPILFHTPMF